MRAREVLYLRAQAVSSRLAVFWRAARVFEALSAFLEKEMHDGPSTALRARVLHRLRMLEIVLALELTKLRHLAALKAVAGRAERLAAAKKRRPQMARDRRMMRWLA